MFFLQKKTPYFPHTLHYPGYSKFVFNDYLIIYCFAGEPGAAGIKGSPGSPGSAGLPGFPVRFHSFEALGSIWSTLEIMVAVHIGCQFGASEGGLLSSKALS